MDLGGKHPQPLQGVAKGNVRIEVESQPVLNVTDNKPGGGAPEKKTLTAAEVRFAFRPDTSSLKDAETVGPGTIVISPTGLKVGERDIMAGRIPHDLRRAQPY